MKKNNKHIKEFIKKLTYTDLFFQSCIEFKEGSIPNTIDIVVNDTLFANPDKLIERIGLSTGAIETIEEVAEMYEDYFFVRVVNNIGTIFITPHI